jgi:hypothetical protein
MPLLDVYLRVQLKSVEELGEAIDPDEYQHSFDEDPTFIGSYVVDVTDIGGGDPAFGFHVVLGFRRDVEEPGEEEQVNQAIGDLLAQVQEGPVKEIRTLRQRP